MGFIEFLDRLHNTLEEIEVHGKNNIESMYACMRAISEMKESIIQSMQAEMAKKQPVGGDEVGRQSDIGAESSNDSNGE